MLGIEEAFAMPEAPAQARAEDAAADDIVTTGAASSSTGLQDAISERVVVSPCGGRFASLPPEDFTSEGEWVEPGQAVAQIDTGGAKVPVLTRFRGWVMGTLALEGQRVTEGAALLWIRAL
jgi:biotin carboxyl carrier protein